MFKAEYQACLHPPELLATLLPSHEDKIMTSFFSFSLLDNLKKTQETDKDPLSVSAALLSTSSSATQRTCYERKCWISLMYDTKTFYQAHGKHLVARL